MDNNNNNDFMSIFNDAHVDLNQSQSNNEQINNPQNSEQNTFVENNPWVDKPKNTYIQNDESMNESLIQNNDISNIDVVDSDEISNSEQNISNLVNINKDQINEQILGQSDIIKNTGDMEHSETEEQEKVTEKSFDHIDLFSVLLLSIIIGIIAFAGFNIAEKYFNKNNMDKGKELVEEIYNFEESFSAYIMNYNKTKPIKNTIACVSEGDKNTWLNHPEYKFDEDCTTLFNEYKQTTSAVKIPSYGIIYINDKGIKNGTHFIYDDGYVCSYDSNEEKLFKCEKTE